MRDDSRSFKVPFEVLGNVTFPPLMCDALCVLAVA